MNSKEILTLQFGHYANFVGTHWWNIQETGFDYTSNDIPSEIDHDVLFREGLTQTKQTTFTPRVLLVDLKGSQKSLRKDGDLYDPTPPPKELDALWDQEAVEVDEVVKYEKNDFLKDLEQADDCSNVLNKQYNLEETVSVWSDYLYTRFHPRSVNIVENYQHNDESFNAFPVGRNLWNEFQFQDDFVDKIRSYVEECDNFQGFQILTDVTDAFGGLSNSCLDYLQDEYERKSKIVFPFVPSYISEDYQSDEERLKAIINDSLRTINLVLSFSNYEGNSSLFVPMCAAEKGWRHPGAKRKLYHNTYDHKLSYHSSAVLASALDTFTLKYRLKSNDNFSLIDLCSDLNSSGRKAAAASLTLPFSLNEDADLIDCLDNWDGPLTQSLTPSCTIGSERIFQHLILRGVPESKLKRPLHQAGKQRDLPAYKTNNIKEMLSLYLACTTYASASNVTVVNKPLSVKTPYPNIFDGFVNIDGFISNKMRPDNLGVRNVPVLAGLHNGAFVGEIFESLHEETKRIKFARFHQFVDNGIDNDYYVDCVDKILQLKENYEESYVI